MHELDLLIERFRQASASVNTNLLALEHDTNWQMLDAAPLTGTTASQWSDVQLEISALWQMACRFDELLERARVVRGHARTLSPATERELRDLLQGRSILLHEESVRLAERDLLTPARSRAYCSADELLTLMRDVFDRANGVLSDVSAAWDTIAPRVAEVRVKVVECRELAGSSTALCPESLTRADQQLAQIGERLLADPLAVTAQEVEVIEHRVGALCQTVAQAASLRDDVRPEVARAHALIDEVRRSEHDAVRAHDDVVAKVLASDIEVPGNWYDGVIEEWTEVQQLIDDETWLDASSALERWRSETASVLEQARTYIACCREPLEIRNQLRGRLDAYRAKSVRLGLLETSEVAVAYERARVSLYTAPSDLEAAAVLVSTFQTAQSRAARQSERTR